MFFSHPKNCHPYSSVIFVVVNGKTSLNEFDDTKVLPTPCFVHSFEAKAVGFTQTPSPVSCPVMCPIVCPVVLGIMDLILDQLVPCFGAHHTILELEGEMEETVCNIRNS